MENPDLVLQETGSSPTHSRLNYAPSGDTLRPDAISSLFGALCCFQHCTGHIMKGSWKGRENQYILFVRVLYCKLLTNGQQLPAFPLEAVPGTEPRPQRWEARVLHSATVPSHNLLKMCNCYFRKAYKTMASFRYFWNPNFALTQ